MWVWTLPGIGPTPAADACASDAMSGIIGRIGAADFGSAALAALNTALAVDSWAVYRLRPGEPPTLHVSGSTLRPDSTRACFDSYRDGLYAADRSFDRARTECHTAPVMAHCRADELASAHREQIYVRHGLTERLSVVASAGSGALLTINLYRHLGRRAFSDADFELLNGAAGWLLASVQRHLELTPSLPGDAPVAALSRREPGLTPRELQVCERLLRGWTYDGIASDLQLSVATVKTYRNRAFDRLGIHFRSELFGLVMGRVPQPQ